MGYFSTCLGTIAPVYNLVFVAIVLYLFYELFSIKKKSKKVFLKPWKLIFAGVIVFIIITTFVILRQSGLPSLPIEFSPLLEMTIMFLFIYALLLQREHIIKQGYHKKK